MKAVVVAGGDPDPRDAEHLADADIVVAADAGAAWLEEIGRRPDLLIGDLDSIEPALVARLVAAGVSVERHPVDKDATDAELALDRALAAGAEEVVVIGALAGKRLDHALANLLLLADSEWAAAGAPDRDLRIVRGATAVRVVHAGRRQPIDGGAGTVVSLLPIGGDATGVRTAGLRFPLDGETLRLGRSRGVSNVVDRAPASVSLEGGTLLVVETSEEGE